MTHHTLQIFLLMSDRQPIAAYTDKALADADCYVCNEARMYTEGGDYFADSFDYWVRPLDLVVDTTAA